MRKPHWEIALAEQIKAASGRPFSYGTHDCATWAFDVRRTLTGEDAAADWRGRYTTEIGAARMLRRLGCETVAELACRYLGDPLPTARFARRGDVVLYQGALGICTGAGALFAGASGLRSVPIRSCESAWRV